MDVSTVERPGDAVASVNPDFVGKKRDCLPGHILTLTADGGVPVLLRLQSTTSGQKSQQRCQNEGSLQSPADPHIATSNSIGFCDGGPLAHRSLERHARSIACAI